MPPLTCQSSEALIDLHAADADTPEEAAALQAHLDTCAECRERLDEARTLQVLLDWHSREPKARERLRDRIAGESRPRVWQPTPWLRRLSSLAALLLVVVGLVVLCDTADRPLVAVLTPHDAEAMVRLEFAVPQPAPVPERDPPAVRALGLPPVVLTITLRNDTGRDVRLRLEGTAPHLDVSGPGELRHAGTLAPEEVRLPARGTTEFMLRGIVVTKPGSYRLTGWFQAEATFAATRNQPQRQGTIRVTIPPTALRVPAG